MLNLQLTPDASRACVFSAYRLRGHTQKIDNNRPALLFAQIKDSRNSSEPKEYVLWLGINNRETQQALRDLSCNSGIIIRSVFTFELDNYPDLRLVIEPQYFSMRIRIYQQAFRNHLFDLTQFSEIYVPDRHVLLLQMDDGQLVRVPDSITSEEFSFFIQAVQRTLDIQAKQLFMYPEITGYLSKK